MKKLESLKLSPEIVALIDTSKKLLEEGPRVDTAKSQNLEKLKIAEAELAEAEHALAESDTAAALAINVDDVAMHDAAVAQAKALVDSKRELCNRYKRVIENLKSVGRNHDEKIADIKSALALELSLYSEEVIDAFESALVEQLKPLVNLLAVEVSI